MLRRILRPMMVIALNTAPTPIARAPLMAPLIGRPLSTNHMNLRLLVPLDVTAMQRASYKVKGHLKKRCEHCVYVKRKGRLYVECKVKPRHKQMQMLSRDKIFAED